MGLEFGIEFPADSDWMVFPQAVVEDPSIVAQWAALQARDILKSKGVGFLQRQKKAAGLAAQIGGVADMAIDAGRNLGAVTAYLLDTADVEHVRVARTFTMAQDDGTVAEYRAGFEGLASDGGVEVVARFEGPVPAGAVVGAHVVVGGEHRVMALVHGPAGLLATTLILRDAPGSSDAAVAEAFELLRAVELSEAPENVG